MATLSIILPVYNEAESIAATIREFQSKLVSRLGGAEMIVVEDGSTDGTKAILHQLQQEIPFQLISGDARKGYTRAFKDALRIPTSPLIFFSDSDHQHDPADFFKMYPWASQFDIVSGYKSPRRDPFYRILLSRAYNMILGMLFGRWFHDINSGFKIIKKEVIESVLSDVNDLQHCVMSEFVLKAHLRGFRIKEVPVRHFPREHGASLFNARNLGPVVIQVLKGIGSIRTRYKSSTAT